MGLDRGKTDNKTELEWKEPQNMTQAGGIYGPYNTGIPRISIRRVGKGPIIAIRAVVAGDSWVHDG